MKKFTTFVLAGGMMVLSLISGAQAENNVDIDLWFKAEPYFDKAVQRPISTYNDIEFANNAIDKIIVMLADPVIENLRTQFIRWANSISPIIISDRIHNWDVRRKFLIDWLAIRPFSQMLSIDVTYTKNIVELVRVKNKLQDIVVDKRRYLINQLTDFNSFWNEYGFSWNMIPEKRGWEGI